VSLIIPKWLKEIVQLDYLQIVVYHDANFPVDYNYHFKEVYWSYTIYFVEVMISSDPTYGRFNTVYEARLAALAGLAKDNYPGAALVMTAMELD